MPMMHAAKAPAATAGSRRAPIGMLGIFRAPYAATHPAAGAHGIGGRPRHMRVAALAAICGVIATLYWAYGAVQSASTQRLAAATPAGTQQAVLPDWLATGSGKDSERSLAADGIEQDPGSAGAAAAAAGLHPELQGVLGDWRQRAAAIRRMRRWEHGLGALQPLPPADILAAAAALFAAGGRLQGHAAEIGIGTQAGGALGNASLGLQSYYASWILADLAHWSHSGISQEMVGQAAAARKKCHGSGVRVVVQNGTVWVDHLTPRPPKGWYPATLGPGWVSGKGRVPYILLSLMDVIHEYGDEVPDVDIVLGCGDAPCSRLPKPSSPAARRRRRQHRRLHASAAGGTRLHSSTASSGSSGSGGRSAAHCSGHGGGSSSNGQPEVDAFGSLVQVHCHGIQNHSSSTRGAGSGSPSKAAAAAAGGAAGSSGFNDSEIGISTGSSTGNSGGGGGGSGSGGKQSASDRQWRRTLAEDTVEPPPPLPMFLYDTGEAHADIPFPDFSYWGHEIDRLWEGKDKYVVGWDVQQPMLARLSHGRPWQRRKPQITWRGRHGPGRDQLRQHYILCRERMLNDSRTADANLFNFWWPDVTLPQLSLYRYNVYIESGAWATNFKQKLASGSPVFAIDPRSPEFFSRALRPRVHYWPLAARDMCNQTVATIEAMNRNWNRLHGGATFFDPLSLLPSWPLWRPARSSKGAKSSSSSSSSAPGKGAGSTGAAGGSSGGGSSGSGGSSRRFRRSASTGESDTGGPVSAAAAAALADVGRARRRMLAAQLAGMLDSSGRGGSGSGGDSIGRHKFGSRKLLGPAELAAAQAAADVDVPLPTDMAAAAEAFLEQHLRMEDVRRYLLDVLRMYAALQTFEVQPPSKAVCYNGEALLGQFGVPFAADAAVVAAKYPWLPSFGAGACPRDRLPPDGAQAVGRQAEEPRRFFSRWPG